MLTPSACLQRDLKPIAHSSCTPSHLLGASVYFPDSQPLRWSISKATLLSSSSILGISVSLTGRKSKLRLGRSMAAVPRAAEESLDIRMQRLESLKESATAGVPFSPSELDSAVTSMQNAASGLSEELDWPGLRSALASSAHDSYKDWTKTELAADELSSTFASPDSPAFKLIFQRVFQDGNWEGAAKAAELRDPDSKPWVVLVTGLNGIRKTTCMYQAWFKEVLHAALADTLSEVPGIEQMPDGNNSFFRQLDHIIATVANEEFRTLYNTDGVDRYSALKDGIFSRYRKPAEMWGILLIKEAKKRRLNIMAETSGRDAGMFHYIDHCFPDDDYHKLVIHFDINDITFAERSVDARMLSEMEQGQKALGNSTQEIIKVNSGGPYGSQVLKGVQADSNKVWQEVVSGNLAASWHKACISIIGREDSEWTARATVDSGKEFPIKRL
eukprot:TRINITY_DN32684_c0_g1_i1.p1 TRINITY_DN32684_c0_g1~~TRINITY_DN32684_c0_g1_i1.p1  ORF type:complete len:444 (+),score=72.88 TRINITY_DN32684_c0_g1_i1:54-1385(+)